MEMTDVEEKTTIKHIHESIIIRILCSLPADSVKRCRAVCKSWAALIFSQYFAESYSLSATRPLHFLGNLKNDHKHLLLAHIGQASMSARKNRVVPVITKSVLPCFESSKCIVKLCSTCNFTGFVVAYADFCNGNEFGQPYSYPYWCHVFNPITGQHIVVQQNSGKAPWKRCALLFAHKTNQLKLLKGFYEFGRFEIQTIGTYRWRALKNSTLPFACKKDFGFPCFLNGMYHWLCLMTKFIDCFDPDEEVFHSIPTPRFVEYQYGVYLGTLDACLCICSKGLHINSDLEFWVMKEYGVPESWIRRLVIPNDGIIRFMSDPIRFLKHGENVVVCDKYNVMCYNPNTKKCNFITYDMKSDPIFWYIPVPYVPNFRRFMHG